MKKLAIVLAIAFGSLLFSGVQAQNYYGYYYPSSYTYKVTITNVTKGIVFTPFLAATHKSSISYFNLGDEALPELALLAEGGDTQPLNELLDSVPNQVSDTATTEGLLQPGESSELEITTARGFNRLSLAAMLLPTNDSFAALNTVSLPRRGTKTFFARAYDAGSELNDEICANIPGPQCGGAGASPDEGGEGYVYISPGIHGEADLTASAYDWRDAVLKVTVQRIK